MKVLASLAFSAIIVIVGICGYLFGYHEGTMRIISSVWFGIQEDGKTQKFFVSYDNYHWIQIEPKLLKEK